MEYLNFFNHLFEVTMNNKISDDIAKIETYFDQLFDRCKSSKTKKTTIIKNIINNDTKFITDGNDIIIYIKDILHKKLDKLSHIRFTDKQTTSFYQHNGTHAEQYILISCKLSNALLPDNQAYDRCQGSIEHELEHVRQFYDNTLVVDYDNSVDGFDSYDDYVNSNIEVMANARSFAKLYKKYVGDTFDLNKAQDLAIKHMSSDKFIIYLISFKNKTGKQLDIHNNFIKYVKSHLN